MGDFTVDLCGVRGTLPVPGAEMARYGGNTACVALDLSGRCVILDAGSGLVPLGRSLQAQGVKEIDLVISHAHYDHVIGLPFFAPLTDPDVTLRVWFAGTEGAETGEELLARLLSQPFLPFSRADLRAQITCHALPKTGTTELGGAVLRTAAVHHPGGNTGLRIDHAGASLTYVADFEHDEGAMDAELVALMTGCDLALLDCTYTPEEYNDFKGYGHSHWQMCSALCRRAGVAQWGAIHHAHTRTDTDLDALADQMTRADPAAIMTQEGMRFVLG